MDPCKSVAPRFRSSSNHFTGCNDNIETGKSIPITPIENIDIQLKNTSARLTNVHSILVKSISMIKILDKTEVKVGDDQGKKFPLQRPREEGKTKLKIMY